LSADFVKIVVKDISGKVERGRDKSRDEVNLNISNKNKHQKKKVEIKRKQFGSKEVDFESLVLNQSKKGDDDLRNADEVDNFISIRFRSSKFMK